ncbi:restriction endonuclease subunit S [Candidatus Endomicrobiellum trichonymphae]|uniref:Type I restriction-modification system substrate-binding subunit n=1 Tax=Endomicrobium trichonymphae TaxID=1408204 RepID=B1GZ39_ENDTX|nr:restriction endonuclease subunit S [Candidatus Endomicrobium trichonymphae]BAG13521.1 type I restriction-modification system substrate-binding subunit [Candidatus Endomicrobium trichonymphae]
MEEYSKYKPSGIEWIGDIPKNWNFVSCRLIVSERNERNKGMKNNNYLSLMANIGVIPYEEKGDIGNKKPENLEKCKIVYEGDLIINSMNYFIGSYGISKYDGICSPVYIVLYANTKVIEPRFAFRVFENPKFQGVAQSFGNGILEHRRAINWDILKNIKIPVPLLEEQRNILSFLDKKTEKIDALISDKEKLIKLLREYRQSIISETVTKGLDKKVQMKHSGIEWIGDIPYDWKVNKFNRIIIRVSTGLNPRNNFKLGDGDCYYVTIKNFKKGKLFLDEKCDRMTKEALNIINERSDLKIDDILFSSIGEEAEAYLISEHPTNWNINESVFTIRVNKDLVLPNFFYYLIANKSFFNDLLKDATGSTFKSIKINSLIEKKVPVPSLKTQKEIANLLDDKTEKIDNLIENITKQIKKLQEYRKSIIGEAVTGKAAI